MSDVRRAAGSDPVTGFDPTLFPILEKGNTFEEFELGRVFDHHWGRTMTQADNVLFNTSMCFWNPMMLNAPYAREHGHPDTPVNPMLVLCTAVGLSVEDLSERGTAFLGVDDCQFQADVYPGDTIHASSEVVTCRPSSSRPGHGIVGWRTRVVNQRGELVLTYLRTNIIGCETRSSDPTTGSRP